VGAGARRSGRRREVIAVDLPGFDVLLHDLAFGGTQQGAAKGTIKGRLVGGGARGCRL